MRKSKFRAVIILIALLLSGTPGVYGHGVVYEAEPSGDNKIAITLKWSDPSETKGLAVSYFYLVKGKTLKIGYEPRDGLAPISRFEFDLVSAIPPIRIVVDRVGDTEGVPFEDIKGIEAEEYIHHLHDAGIINGRDSNLFKPFDTITRAEFTVMMVKALKLTGTADNAKGFTDAGGHWARDAILLAVRHGLISGYEDKTIRPDNPITVGEVSAVISRAFSFKTQRNGFYGRLKQGAWYSPYVKKMFDTGILGVKDSIYSGFDEQTAINRSNCAMMVSRALSTY